MGTIDIWMTADRPNKIYLIAELSFSVAIKNIVNAIPDLTPEANKFMTFGVKKIIKKSGNI